MPASDSFRLIARSILFAALVAVILIAAAQLLSLLILAFGAVVIGVLLHGLAGAIGRRSPLRGGWSLAAAILLIAAVLAAGVWLFGQQISGQFSRLAQTMPAALENLRQQLASLPGGEQLIAALRQPSLGNEILSRLTGAVLSLAGIVTDFLLLLFGAVFIAANPGLYRKGLVKLVPPNRRSLADEALGDAGEALRKWMLGQLVSMAIIGLLTGLGLWLIGVPSAMALGLIAGLAEIIPWAGPIIAAIPILVIALAEGPQTALLALGLMLAVQQIEGSLIMPYVQKKAVSLPPALTVFGVVAGGLLFGPVGLIFAAPLLVVVYVLVKRLYVKEALDTETDVPGEQQGR